MATVEVEIDLDDIDFDDLCLELFDRIVRFKRSKSVQRDVENFHTVYEEEVEVIAKFFAGLYGKDDLIRVQTLRDVLYNEFLEEIRNKYSQDQLELMINTFENKKS